MTITYTKHKYAPTYDPKYPNRNQLTIKCKDGIFHIYYRENGEIQHHCRYCLPELFCFIRSYYTKKKNHKKGKS